MSNLCVEEDSTVLHLNYSGIKELKDCDLNGECFRRAQYLYLTRNLLQTLPKSIGQLVHLRELHLEGNTLHKLPDEIGRLESLQVLNLVSNNLMDIPCSIGDLQSLKKIQISNNHLQCLPDELGQLKLLETLEASSNQLTRLPVTLVNCINLKLLALDKNRLQVFPRQLCRLKCLTELSLAGNLLEYLPPRLFEGLSSLCLLVVDKNPNLTALPPNEGQCIVSQCGFSTRVRHEVTTDRFNQLYIGEQIVSLPCDIEEYSFPGKSCVPCLQEVALRTVFQAWNTDLDRFSHMLPRDLTDYLQNPTCRCIHCKTLMFKSAFPVVYTELNTNSLNLAFCCSIKCLKDYDFRNKTCLFPPNDVH